MALCFVVVVVFCWRDATYHSCPRRSGPYSLRAGRTASPREYRLRHGTGILRDHIQGALESPCHLPEKYNTTVNIRILFHDLIFISSRFRLRRKAQGGKLHVSKRCQNCSPSKRTGWCNLGSEEIAVRNFES